jgi:hypothetical protein
MLEAVLVKQPTICVASPLWFWWLWCGTIFSIWSENKTATLSPGEEMKDANMVIIFFSRW